MNLLIPPVRQSTEYTCGAAALKTVFEYYGIYCSEYELTEKLETTPEYGTPWNKMVEVAKESDLEVFHGRFTIDKIKKEIDNRHPVIVAFQAWGDGHYAVVIGYNSTGFYFEDPYIDHTGFLTFEEFESRWHIEVEAKQINVGLVIRGDVKFNKFVFRNRIERIK